MLFNVALCISIGSILTLIHAFRHSKSDPDGLYLHKLDANGNEITEFIGLPKPKALPHPRDLMGIQARSPLMGRATTLPCGRTTCQELILDWADFSEATNQLASYCSAGQDFHSAVSFKSENQSETSGAVAYVCSYEGRKEGNNRCDYNHAMALYQLIPADCGQYKTGYYMIEDWGISYGYDAPDQCFCHGCD